MIDPDYPPTPSLPAPTSSVAPPSLPAGECPHCRATLYFARHVLALAQTVRTIGDAYADVACCGRCTWLSSGLSKVLAAVRDLVAGAHDEPKEPQESPPSEPRLF